MRPIGFSTGSIFPESPSEALKVIVDLGADAVELSALRMHEVESIVEAIESPLLHKFRWVSIHAPSRFSANDEIELIEVLGRISKGIYPIIVHPDTICNIAAWRDLGRLLVLENMDRRKSKGRYAEEFTTLYKSLPEAGLCLDLAHVRQIDPSLVEAFQFVRLFGNRLVELHISEVSSASSHTPMSMHADSHLRDFLRFLPVDTPTIIESVLPNDAWAMELKEVRRLFSSTQKAERIDTQ